MNCVAVHGHHFILKKSGGVWTIYDNIFVSNHHTPRIDVLCILIASVVCVSICLYIYIYSSQVVYKDTIITDVNGVLFVRPTSISNTCAQ